MVRQRKVGMAGMARHVQAYPGTARHSRHGVDRAGWDRLALLARLDQARPGSAWGERLARQRVATVGKARPATAGLAWHGLAAQVAAGLAWSGEAAYIAAGLARFGLEWSGESRLAWHGWQGLDCFGRHGNPSQGAAHHGRHGTPRRGCLRTVLAWQRWLATARPDGHRWQGWSASNGVTWP